VVGATLVVVDNKNRNQRSYGSKQKLQPTSLTVSTLKALSFKVFMAVIDNS